MASEKRHITQIMDSYANCWADGDEGQVFIFGDADPTAPGCFAHKNDGATLMYVHANQYSWDGADKVYQEVEFGAVAVNGNLDIVQYLRHIGDTDTCLQFAVGKMYVAAGNHTMILCDGNTAQHAVTINGGMEDVDFIVKDFNGASAIVVQASDGLVGIGGVPVDSLLHILAGSAGTVAALAGTVVTIEDNASSYISMLSPAANSNGIYLGSASDNDEFSIIGNHNSGHLLISAAGGGVFDLCGAASAELQVSAVSVWKYLYGSGAPSTLYVNYGNANLDFRVDGVGISQLLHADASANKVAFASGGVGGAAVVTVTQADATGESCLSLAQVDESEGFIDFVGSDRGVIVGGTNSVSSLRVEINGAVKRIALYADA
jgi:hypothetical protein